MEQVVVGQQEDRCEVPRRPHPWVCCAVEPIRLVEKVGVAARRVTEHRLIPDGWDEPVRVVEVNVDEGQGDRPHLASRQPSSSWRVAGMTGIPPSDIARTGLRPSNSGNSSSIVGHASAYALL